MKTVYLLCLEQFSRQQNKHWDYDRSKRHAKAQVPTNWTQSCTPFPPFGCREGEKEAFPPTVKFPFPETAAEGTVKM